MLFHQSLFELVSFIIKNADGFICYKTVTYLNNKLWVCCDDTKLLQVEYIDSTIDKCSDSVVLLLYDSSNNNIPIVDKDVVIDDEVVPIVDNDVVIDNEVEPVDMNNDRSISVPNGGNVIDTTIVNISVPIRGIRNNFNNCYLNSSFQCLSVIPGISQMMTLKNDNTDEDNIRKQFVEFINNYNSVGVFEVDDLERLLNVCPRFKNFSGGGHHCILEFLNIFSGLFDDAFVTSRLITIKTSYQCSCGHENESRIDNWNFVRLSIDGNEEYQLELQVNNAITETEDVEKRCDFPACLSINTTVCNIIYDINIGLIYMYVYR